MTRHGLILFILSILVLKAMFLKAIFFFQNRRIQRYKNRLHIIISPISKMFGLVD